MILYRPPSVAQVGRGGFYRPPLLSLLGGGVPPGLVGLGVLSGNKGEVVTFTRATTKTVQSGPGGVVSVGSGLPGVDYRGLSCEAAHTNRILDSQDLSSGWTQRGTGVVSTSPRTAPDGGAASRLSGLGQPGNGDVFISAVGFTNGSQSPSFWVYRVSTTGFLRCQSATTAPGVWNINLSLLPDAWVRVTAAHLAVTVVQPFSTSDGSGGLLFARDTDDPGPATIIVDLWGVQEEDGDLVHSLVPTTSAAATANQDVASLPSTNLPSAFGSVALNVTPLWSAGTSGVKTLVDSRNSATSDSGFAAYVNGDMLNIITASPTNSSTATSSVLTWNAGQQYRIQATWGGGAVYLYRDGLLVASSASSVMPSSYGANLFVGIDYPGAGPLDGFVSDLRVFTI